MVASSSVDRGIYSLPNELLYTILEPLATKTILAISSTSRRIHALCVRLLHNRLTLAASLADHVLYLEAYPPSAQLTASGLFCVSLGTPNLQDALDSPDNAGKIGRLGNLYTVFRPQRTVPKRKTSRPGDIPGSRTFIGTQDEQSGSGEDQPDVIGETVSLDPHELFSQICAVAHLVMIGRRGLFEKQVEVCDGLIRVWRDWLKDLAEGGKSESVEPQVADPAQDRRILWLNKGDHTLGIKCAVTERKWRRDNPILLAREDEVAVSYHVAFEELYIRTSHLLFKLEESLKQESNRPSKAMVFI